MDNFSNNKLYNPHGYKEEVKIKYDSVKAIAERFLNGTAVMMVLLTVAVPALDWVGYCALTPNEQLAWKERGDELTKSIIYLMNSKNKQAKKDLSLAYYQKNMTSYLANIKVMA